MVVVPPYRAVEMVCLAHGGIQLLGDPVSVWLNAMRHGVGHDSITRATQANQSCSLAMVALGGGSGASFVF